MLGMFLITATAQFLLTVGLARYLPQRTVGLLLETIALFMIASRWTMLGADSGVIRTLPRLRVAGRRNEMRPTLRVAWPPVLIASVAAAGLGLLLAPALARTFYDVSEHDTATASIRVVAPFLPLAALGGLALAASRGLGSTRLFAGQNAAVAVGRCVAVVSLASAGVGGVALAATWAAPAVPSFVVALVVLGALLRVHDVPDAAPDGARLGRDFWRFALPRGSAAVLVSTVTWFDVLLVGHYASTEDAAVYAIASRFFMVGTYALQAIGTAVAPQFSALLARRDKRAAEAVYQAGTWWAMCLSWPFYLTLIVFPTTLLSLIFGEQYEAATSALVILSIAGLVDLATGNAQALLLMSGRSGVFLANAATALTANIALNVVLIPRYGITGAAIAWATSIGLSNLAAAAQVRYFVGVRPFGRGFAVVAASALIAFLAVPLASRLVFGDGVAALLLGVVVGLPLFVGALWRRRDVVRLSELRKGALAAHRASVPKES